MRDSSAPAPRTRDAGFTLIELLVSVALLAIISVMTFSAIQTAFNVYEKLFVQARQQSHFVIALGILNDDMANLIARPVRVTEGTRRDAFYLEGSEGDYLVEFTRGGLYVYRLDETELRSMGLASPQTDLARIAYHFADNTFYRYEWTTLDPRERSEENAKKRALLKNVEEVQIVAYSQDRDGALREEYQWPPVEGARDRAALLLPVAVSILIRFQNQGEHVLFFPGVNSG